jgi:bacteriocin biosynthesis cyclodehydratase domain-containing protein
LEIGEARRTAETLVLMDEIYQFKPHLRLVSLGRRGVFLIGEREHYLLSGELYAELCPLIDGKRTVHDLTTALEGRLSAAEVSYGVSVLFKQGYLVEPEEHLTPERAAFWQSVGVDPKTAAQNIAKRSIRVQALGQFDLTQFIQALTDFGMPVEDAGLVQIIVTEDYLMPELDFINRRALEEKQTWMLVKPKGSVSWIGPMFRPDAGPCWACLAQRIQSNRPVETFLQRSDNDATPILPPQAGAETSIRAALDLTAMSVARWIANNGEGDLDNQLLTVDHKILRIDHHRVVKRPQCPQCGNSELLTRRGFQNIALRPRIKAFTDDGGHRCVDPHDTYELYRHQVSPITGVVSSLGELTTHNHPLAQIYAASHFVTPATDQPAFDDFQQGSLGKGRTAIQSRASALCEAIERWSALYQGDEPRIRASFVELRQEAIHPQDLLNFSQSQYQTRSESNEKLLDKRLAIPLPFDERISMDWTPVWSISDRRHRYIPTAYCYANVPVTSGGQFCRYTSNGHAAGNCLEEALLQGFLELVERDAAAIWWYNRLQRPEVSLESFEQPYFLALRNYYLGMGWQLWVCDLTTDLKIPTFVALAHQKLTNQFMLGLGSHFEARLGIQRALTELNQLYNTRQRQRVPWDEEALRDRGYFFPDQYANARTQDDFKSAQRPDLLEDVQVCCELADRLGLDILVLDQTRPDVGLSVVKVIVPGLRHIWPRLGPGRLYDVPPRLGWLPEPLNETELNPVALFL